MRKTEVTHNGTEKPNVECNYLYIKDLFNVRLWSCMYLIRSFLEVYENIF